MSLKLFDGYTWLIVGFTSFFLSLFLEGSYFFSSFGDFSVVCDYFWCDGVSFYLSLLSILLWWGVSFFFSSLDRLTVFMISLSVLSSVISYFCVHAFFFWFFYEMSILPLLFLLVSGSPYSERYVASWYLLGYVVITSLPMLACLFYFSLVEASFNVCEWSLGANGYSAVLVFLAVLFITKIPLFPFHVWLPIVHAEASSIVSVCLSGYVMKLGILGGFRFCSRVLPDYVFSSFYSLLVLLLCIVFFFGAARELDGKRWLALMSLCHITIPVVCFSVGLFDSCWVSFYYCLGHGLSAASTFILLWFLYDVTGSRNWLLVKNGLSSSLLLRFCCGASLCTVCSLPPTLSFFSEVVVMCYSGLFSTVFILGLGLYLFLGGLVPLFLLGCLLTRHYSISLGSGLVFNGVCSVSFLVLWSFLFFVVL